MAKAKRRHKYEIVSADAHILEPPHIWKEWLPKKFQDRAPQLVKDEDGGDAWLFADSSQPNPIGLVSTPGVAWKDMAWTGVTYETARDGCYDGKARLQDMDYDGIDAEALFAPQRTISHFLGEKDEEFAIAGVEAYNNFLFEEFCAPDRDRLIPLYQISSINIEQSLKEVEDAADRGFKGVVISGWPSGGESISRDDDPFWAACQEAGLTVTNHITMIGRESRIKQAEAAKEQVQTGNEKGRDAKAKAVGGLGSVFTRVPPNIAQIIVTGTFDRFPDLNVLFVEVGAGWIPHFLEQMDDRYWRNRAWAELELEHEPSYYWHHNCAATFIVDRSAILLRHSAGVDTILWSTDYPHHGNDWPYSRNTINNMMFDVPEDERHQIVAGNAVRLFDLPQQEIEEA